MFRFTRTAAAVFFACSSMAACSAFAQDALTQLRTAAQAALGDPATTRIEFTATGWEACLGQPWNISEGWARWSLADYRRVIDYGTGTSLQTAQRQSGMDEGRLGGCGAQPGSLPVAQQSSIAADSPWATQLLLWMTPHGFLELAGRNNAQVTRDGDGWQVEFSFNQNGVAYPVSGRFNARAELVETQTRIDNSVFGDMLVETRFGPYQGFAGVNWPASIEQLQGGHAVLNLTVTGVIPDSTAPAAAPPRQGAPGGGAGGPATAGGEPLTELTPDIVVSNGAYQSVIVNQPEGIIVIDGLQSDARSAEIIAQAKERFPGKSISHVITTHNHFDHASGLRLFVNEGAIIVTHFMNADFFQTALAAPRTLEHPDPQTREVQVLGVGDYYSLGSGDQQIELYRIENNPHADDMLVAFLPAISTIVEADILQPWISPAFGGGFEGGHPFLVNLADELERLGLPYEQFVPIHRPPQPPLMTRSDLLQAIGRE
jgi:glyoxylase-like metal-dependent hydrolase (beta-lactamase superfamily II)